jgi:uncharacterized protein YraI
MNMKAILAGTAMMMVAGIPAAAEAANAVTSATVNFRASPGGAVFAAIPYGAPVTVLGRSGNWCQTEWLGRIGWVSCRYVNVGVAQAPRFVPAPTYPYGYGDPYVYGGPTIGFSFGFGDFDRGYRYRDYRPRWYGSREWRDGDRWRSREYRRGRDGGERRRRN